MAWRIELGSGLGDLKFGMPPSRIATFLGLPQSTDTLYGGTLTEYRGMNTPVCNYENEELRCIDTHWSLAPLLLADLDLYTLSPHDLLVHLEIMNGGALYLYGTIFFMDIGLSACNYVEKDRSIRVALDEDDDERGIGIFRAGAFAQFVDDCAPMSFL